MDAGDAMRNTSLASLLLDEEWWLLAAITTRPPEEAVASRGRPVPLPFHEAAGEKGVPPAVKGLGEEAPCLTLLGGEDAATSARTRPPTWRSRGQGRGKVVVVQISKQTKPDFSQHLHQTVVPPFLRGYPVHP